MNLPPLFFVVSIFFFYSSKGQEKLEYSKNVDELTNEVITVSDILNLTQKEEDVVYSKLMEISNSNQYIKLGVKDNETTLYFINTLEEQFITGINNGPVRIEMRIDYKDSKKYYKNFRSFAGMGYNQNVNYRSNNIEVPFTVADEAPVFPGCEKEDNSRKCFQYMLQEHINDNLRYPEEAQKLGLGGRVNIMFTINQSGDISNIRKWGPDKILETEAERVIALLPKMKPGVHNGKTVNIPFAVPILFKLPGKVVE